MKSDTDALLDFDKSHIWHPYTSMTQPLPVYPVASAKGVMLTLEDGRELVDGMSSWWAAIHGYNHPVLNRAAENQLKKMSHVMFGGITHKPAVDLCRKLVELTPDSLEKVFLCDSGSVSVEVAVKMAIQYWFSKGKKNKHQLATIRGGYHGDTFGAMAVCDPVTGMHEIFKGILPTHYFADRPACSYAGPWEDSDLDNIKSILENHHDQIAAVILEPIVQGAGGMRFYHPNFLKGVRKLCDQFNVLLIADEIATGFGRTGSLFACEKSGICPDILCLGKALTGGYMTLAATLATNDVATTVSEGVPGVFMHGPTFMGNPLACAVALASLELLAKQNWRQKVAEIEDQLIQELSLVSGLSHVKDVRVLGAIGVVELESPVDMAKIQKAFVDRGVWIRPFGRLVYAMPPFMIEPEQLSKVTGAICDVVSGL